MKRKFLTLFALLIFVGSSLAQPMGDQIKDPGEVENLDLVLAKPAPLPEFSSPAKVIDYVHKSLGAAVTWEWSDSPANVVIVRNAGIGFEPNSQEASYDDLFLLVFKDKVLQFHYGNAEGTEHPTYVQTYGYDKHVDPITLKAGTPALDEGAYRYKVALHQSSYKALHVYDWQYNRMGLPSQRLNGKYNRWDVGAVNVHKGGSLWNWSVGCLTIHYGSWDRFIEHFTMGQWGRLYVIGWWSGSYHRDKKEVFPQKNSSSFKKLYEKNLKMEVQNEQ